MKMHEKGNKCNAQTRSAEQNLQTRVTKKAHKFAGGGVVGGQTEVEIMK